ncbi:MAG: ShlB/FhaC/HecB family hemolysin secretion/activation protein [Pseudomonadota bacterium]
MKNTKLTSLALAALLTAAAAPALAQTPAPAAPPEPTLEVRRYVIDGALPLSESEVSAILAPFTGPGRTLADIQRAAEALEQRLRANGQAFHRMFVPAQRPIDGEVRLQVVSFKLGQVDVAGNRHFDTANVRASLPTLVEGQAPEVSQLGADISASNNNPAKQVSVTFRESRQPNTVDALVRVQDTSPIAFIASLTANQHVSGGTNTGNIVRLTGAFQHANLFNRDHVMTLSYTTDPRHVSDVTLLGAYYQIPLYGTGMTASAYYTQSDINSGRVQQGAGFFDVSGSGRFYGLRLSKALARTGSLQPTISAAIDERIFENSTTFNGVQIQPDVSSRVLSLQASLRDETSWGTWSASLEHALNIGGGSNNSDATHGANGGERNWRLWRYSAELVAPVSGWQMTGRLRGQTSGNFLVSGEQFGLGGANSVRGFGDRVVAGEKGHQWSLETMGPALWDSGLRPVVFVDGGRVLARATGITESISSAGVGVRWSRSNFQVSVDLAKVIDDTSTATGSKPVRLNLAVISRF